LYEIPNEETDESELIHNNYNEKSSNSTGDEDVLKAEAKTRIELARLKEEMKRKDKLEERLVNQVNLGNCKS
jgi:hypothetical protein